MERKTLSVIRAFGAVFLFGIITVLGGVGVSKQESPIFRAFVRPYRVYPGQFIVVFVEGIDIHDELSLETDLPRGSLKMYPYREGLVGALGVDCRTDPGQYYVQVRVLGEALGIHEQNLPFVVESKNFPSQYLEVSPQKLESRTSQRWQEDLHYTRMARSESSTSPLWEDKFVVPLQGKETSEFGLIRYINTQEAGRHTGIDIAAPKGTPVVAANSGVVRLAKFLNITGYTIIIDHGFNLFTSYSHLEGFLTQEGEEVGKGDNIGRVGASGFATGNHLHWGAIVGSVFIDPRILVGKEPLEVFEERGD